MFLQKNLPVKRRRRAEKPENVEEVIKNSQNYFFPCEQRFLSCMAFSVYKVVGMACLLRS